MKCRNQNRPCPFPGWMSEEATKPGFSFLCYIMVALWNRADHYIFILFLLSFFSSANLSGRRLDVYHTSTHSVALVRI